jgi:hypothetical protein
MNPSGHAYSFSESLWTRGCVMDKVLTIVGLLVCLGLVFYYDASIQSTTNEFRSSILYTPEEIEAVAIQTVDVAEETEVTEAMIPELEYQLEKQENVAGYIVETYREYEIYSDENGNIIKKVPTSHLDFIRYKR